MQANPYVYNNNVTLLLSHYDGTLCQVDHYIADNTCKKTDCGILGYSLRYYQNYPGILSLLIGNQDPTYFDSQICIHTYIYIYIYSLYIMKNLIALPGNLAYFPGIPSHNMAFLFRGNSPLQNRIHNGLSTISDLVIGILYIYIYCL